jgi:hypothetical protein
MLSSVANSLIERLFILSLLDNDGRFTAFGDIGENIAERGVASDKQSTLFCSSNLNCVCSRKEFKRKFELYKWTGQRNTAAT